MTRPVVLRARVRTDIENAARWYEAECEGLGAEYVAVVGEVLSALQQLPARYPEVHGRVRRALTHRFSYAVFFIVEVERIVVLAVLHQAANPAHWPRR